MPSTLDQFNPETAWETFVPNGDQPWNRRLAAHLFRRAGFGATSSELDDAVERSPNDVVKSLVDGAAEPDGFKNEMAALTQATLATSDNSSLSGLWLNRMMRTPAPLLEKMTLFWHGHFATSADKVDDARIMHAQHEMLRRHALGDFGAMVQEVSQDPAMLIYLDSVTNRKLHPNENFAREVMELFCLGEGNYAERDIQELARCFTGWEVKRRRFRFNKYQHDFGSKEIFGQTGNFTGKEGVEIVLKQTALERFIVRKLVRFFVVDEPELPDEFIAPLARKFRDDGLQIAPTIQRILSSNLFFSDVAIGRRVRSPVELGVGLLRSLDGSTNVYDLATGLAEVGQNVFFPPNVKGWDGGRTWINSSTLLGRANLVRRLLASDKTRFGLGSIEDYLKTHHVNSSAARLVSWLDELLLAVPLNDDVRRDLESLASKATDERRLRELIHTVSTLPEFQLA